MKNERLRLYRIDMKYIRDLSKVDDNVFSVSPQSGKDTRPFVGVVVVAGDKRYCVPLSSPKPKHEKMKSSVDFSKIVDGSGKLIGVLNFNNMIPVDECVFVHFDIGIKRADGAADKAYKRLAANQLRWCNDNRDVIARKANKVYALVTENSQKSRGLVKRCCDFKKLEAVLAKWMDKAR